MNRPAGLGPDGSAPRPGTLRRLLPWAVTMGIFVALFSQIDGRLFWESLRRADLGALTMALLLFVPIISGSVERWRWMLKDHAALPFGLGVRIFLAATSLNSVVPSKLGDLGKAIFLERAGVTDLERASSSVLLEKLLDLAGLCTVFLAAFFMGDARGAAPLVTLLFSAAVLAGTTVYLTAHRPWNGLFPVITRLLGRWPTLQGIVEDSPRFTEELAARPARLLAILAASPALWVLHMLQVFFFFEALNADVSLILVAGLTPIAILVGLLPISVAGMGTRDAALVGLFLPWVPPPTMVGIGLLMSTRYWLPSALGVFFLPRLMNRKAE